MNGGAMKHTATVAGCATLAIRIASFVAIFIAIFIALSPLAGPSTALAAQTPAAPAIPPVADTIPTPAATTRDTVANRPVVHECDAARPEWIFCDDFETDRLRQYFEYTHPDSSFERADSVGVLGSAGMRVHFRKGQVDAGSLKVAFGRTPSSYMRAADSGGTAYREIYWRMYVRNDSAWTGGGGDKLSRALSLASESWAEAMGAPVWSSGAALPGANYLAIDPFSGTDTNGTLRTTTYNDFPHLRWLGAVRGATPIFDQSHVGRWYCVEAHVRLNDAGQHNGTFELWIDDWLEARRGDLNWVGQFAGYGLNAVFFENYWNAGSPVAQNRYIDNLVISTRRIGCGRLITP
jgi:hypothetical protein